MAGIASKESGRVVSLNEFIIALTMGNQKLEQYAERVYREKVSPLVFILARRVSY